MSVPESSFGAEQFATDRAVKFMLWVTFGILTVKVILMVAAQVHLYGDGPGICGRASCRRDQYDVDHADDEHPDVAWWSRAGDDPESAP